MMFELLDTPGSHYLYDAVENQIVPVSGEDSEKLSRYIKGERDPEIVECVERYQGMGLCTDKVVEEIENPMNELAPYYLNERLENLILQVTQQCNLRCSYCVYSGKYINRTHNNSVMSYELACRAVDFFMQHNLLVEKSTIGFYGGEPLLQFELIKKIVNYVKKNYANRSIQFNTTVNGTLMKKNVVDFMVENDFSVTLSIDGPREIHDKNRCFETGDGSFDIIMDNLKYVKDTYPDYYKRIFSNTVLAPECNYEDIFRFFEENEYMKEIHPRLGMISSSGIKEISRVTYTKELKRIQDDNRTAVIAQLLGKELCGKSYRMLDDYKMELKKYWKILQGGKLYIQKNHPSGPCVVGSRRMFVTVDGDFYPCEKLPEIEKVKIGTLEDGFDIKKIRELMNIGKLTEEKCKNCWAFQFCYSCVAACITEEGVSKSYREYSCENVKTYAKSVLKDICILIENGYDFQGANKNENISDI